MLSSEFRRTSIVATLGPASSDRGTLGGLIDAGIDVVRLNFSHGDQEEKGRLIELVRQLEKAAGRPVAILQDLQGPKIRVGRIPDGPIELRPGAEIDIFADGRDGKSGAISTTRGDLGDLVRPGGSIYLDDGSLELRVLAAGPEVVRCVIVVGGELSSGKGVNIPGATMPERALTEKDVNDLRFGLRRGVDYVAMSFVRRPQDATEARGIMAEEGIAVPLLAKIEKQEAVGRIASVLRAFDGAMVARGDLGIELLPEKVPGVQKRIIGEALRLHRPTITATQMLESMTTNARPTRAEASDVANAVLDGSHAVMLSGETAIGRHPVDVVRAMHRIVVEAERLDQWTLPPGTGGSSVTRAMADAAVALAGQIGASALVAFTRSGRTAQMLSSLESPTPIVALCEDEAMARRLCLWRGVMPLVIGRRRESNDPSERILRELRQRSILPSGSQVIALGAAPGSRAGQTNFLRILRV